MVRVLLLGHLHGRHLPVPRRGRHAPREVPADLRGRGGPGSRTSSPAPCWPSGWASRTARAATCWTVHPGRRCRRSCSQACCQPVQQRSQFGQPLAPPA